MFAAASMRDALIDVNQRFEQDHAVTISVSYGGSQTLAQQIVAGAPADVFLSAGFGPVTFLDEQRKIIQTPTPFIKNRLVVVSSIESAELMSFEGVIDNPNSRLAIANPNFAPAGIYARESLVESGLWDSIQQNIVLATDVRAALSYVKTHSADFAIVYETDALNTDGVRISDVIQTGLYTEIIYPAVVPSTTGTPSIALQYIDFLTKESAGLIFETHGFEHIVN